MLLYFYKINFVYKTKQKNSFKQRVEKYKLLNLVETFYGGKLPQKKLRYTRKVPNRLNSRW